MLQDCINTNYNNEQIKMQPNYNSWADFIAYEKQKDYFKNLQAFVDDEYANAGKPIYPPKDLIFNALNTTDINDVKVVIVGQDPYHNPNEAMGLSFSVPYGIKVPRSLQNIYKEIQDEYKNCSIDTTIGDLLPWANQGVLLLNSVLTVRENTPGSHAGKGWETFTDNVLRALNQLDRPIVYMLWGNYAKSKGELITNPKQLKLKAAHPSPFSARNGFFGCGHFAKANDFLMKNGIEPIRWDMQYTYVTQSLDQLK